MSLRLLLDLQKESELKDVWAGILQLPVQQKQAESTMLSRDGGHEIPLLKGLTTAFGSDSLPE
jgi:hypothetical protein